MTIPASNSPSEFCFGVDITDDRIVEPNEEFVVSLEVPSGTDGEAGSIASTTITIVDDDGRPLVHVIVCGCDSSKSTLKSHTVM